MDGVAGRAGIRHARPVGRVLSRICLGAGDNAFAPGRHWHACTRTRSSSTNLFEFLALEPVVASPNAARRPHRRASTWDSFSRMSPSAIPVQTGPRSKVSTFTCLREKRRRSSGPTAPARARSSSSMCRLYDPSEGSIEIDGIDIRRFKLRDLRNLISALFQPSVRYSIQWKRNIRLGSSSAVYRLGCSPCRAPRLAHLRSSTGCRMATDTAVGQLVR